VREAGDGCQKGSANVLLRRSWSFTAANATHARPAPDLRVTMLLRIRRRERAATALLPATLELAELSALVAYGLRQARKRRALRPQPRLPIATFLAPSIWLVCRFEAWTPAS